MSIEYAAAVEDPFGNHVATFRNFVDPTDGGGAGLDYILNVSSASSLLLTVPAHIGLDPFPIDGRILPMRSIHGHGFYNDNQACYLIRKRTITPGWIRITAHHANSLLDRRIVAYDTGTTFADKAADNAGDQIKAYVRENMGASIDASRDTVTEADLVTPGYLVIEADKGDGQSLEVSTSRGKLLGVAQRIADSSTQKGTYLSFGLLYGGDKKFYLTTRATQWGTDRRYGQPGQVIFSPERGNLVNWKLEIDNTEAITVAIAGGDGQGTERVIQVASDFTNDISPFRETEGFFDAPNTSDVDVVLEFARASLRQNLAQVSFTADYNETPNATRGIHFDLGDIVTARVTFQGHVFQFDCRLDTIYTSCRLGKQNTRIDLVGPI